MGNFNKKEIVSRVVDLWKEGELSLSKIADTVGKTRSAVAGILHRLRLSGAIESRKKKTVTRLPNKKRTRKSKYSMLTGVDRAFVEPKRMQTSPQVLKNVEHGFGLLIKDLDHNQCRWPTGMDKEHRHLFCGKAGYPYCPDHRVAAGSQYSSHGYEPW